ncbi:protein MEI2-like 5 isoform X1 [Olea europaea var. sylvestris]|uniref:protein MEI2-like 5 isoform X1 n=1 Tax=Olea europaea var. sylvestris TaxID=158386 RepID=UPI000C1CCC27|nr:protein MEI2-like 5 isoform X1 [Olea europaea var. sylvestris]
MEQPLGNSISGNSEGPSNIPFANNLGKEKVAWGNRLGTDAHHTSSDASLFSSSLPVLPHEKLNFNESDQSGQPVDEGFPKIKKTYLEDESKDPLEDIEPNLIGSFLPGNEDELLAGLMDDFDLTGLPTQLEDLDDDFFGSGGGIEIEPELHENLGNSVLRLSPPDGNIVHFGFTSSFGAVSGEHPYGEHPSRTLFVRNINSNVEDSELRSLFEQYGDIRTLYTACKHRGFVMISYYDIRAARTAMRALQNKPLRRRKLDIHFSIPKDNPSDKDVNQGTLVVFNLDASVSNDDLRLIFGAYGEVKEIRETPHKRHHKFIEFYDVRAADAALRALNKSDIAGKRIKLEPSRPGGARRSLMLQLNQEQEQDEALPFHHQVGSPVANSPPGSWANFGSPVDHNSFADYSRSPVLGNLNPVGSNRLPGLASILQSQASNPVKIAPIGKDPVRISHVNQVITKANAAQGVDYQQHYPIPDSKFSSSPGPVSSYGDSKSSSIGTLSGPQFLWGSPTLHSSGVQSNMPNVPSERTNSAWSSPLKGPMFSPSGQRTGYPFQSGHGSFLGSHHVGSAPSGIQPERNFGFFPESPESSHINRAAFGATNLGRNNGNHVMNMAAQGALNMGIAYTGNFSEGGSPGSRMMPMSRNSPIFFGTGSYGGMGATSNDGLMDRYRNRRADSGIQVEDRRQYQLDLEKIVSGEDSRTTLMIKNIPNKYTSKMLLAAIDETHKGTYDFLYLPIDFKNKCNVGYAFINMVSPSHIITFHEAFNGKRWEKFNSEKIASLTYARIQGQAALVSHFQNSSLMNEDKRCRPILFQSEGQGIDDLEPRHTSNLNIFIRQPDGSYVGDFLDSPKSNPDD